MKRRKRKEGHQPRTSQSCSGTAYNLLETSMNNTWNRQTHFLFFEKKKKNKRLKNNSTKEAPSNGHNNTTNKHETTPVHSRHPNRSARSGVEPSTPSNASEEDVKEVANRHLQAKNDERCITRRASRDRANANKTTKFAASWLHKQPVSITTTTKRHRAHSTNS